MICYNEVVDFGDETHLAACCCNFFGGGTRYYTHWVSNAQQGTSRERCWSWCRYNGFRCLRWSTFEDSPGYSFEIACRFRC